MTSRGGCYTLIGPAHLAFWPEARGARAISEYRVSREGKCAEYPSGGGCPALCCAGGAGFLAGGLGVVHGGARPVDQLLGGPRRVREDGYSQAHRDPVPADP